MFSFQQKDDGKKEKLFTAKFLDGMSGMHDSLINEKTDGSNEANSAASNPAEEDRHSMVSIL